MDKCPGRWLGLFLYPASVSPGSHSLPPPPLHHRRRYRLELHSHSRWMVSALNQCRYWSQEKEKGEELYVHQER